MAVPGLEPVATKAASSTTDFDVAEIVDGRERRWVVKAPRSVISGAAMEGEVALLESLALEVDDGALPFEVPRPHGFASLPEGGRAMVFPQIAGRPLNAARLGAIAPNVAGAIAALHALPTRVLAETGLPTYSANEYRERRLAELDEGAATGHVPAGLLQRWEEACEDVRLWRFVPALVHGDLAPEHILVQDARVSGIIEWASAQVGDPAGDLAPLLAEAPEAAVGALLDGYRAAREVEDEYLLARAVLASELAVLRWLMHGVRTEDEAVIDDAVTMLGELAQAVAGSDPISTIGSPEQEVLAPVASAAAPGSQAIPLGEAGGDLGPDDDAPTVEIRREDLGY